MSMFFDQAVIDKQLADAVEDDDENSVVSLLNQKADPNTLICYGVGFSPLAYIAAQEGYHRILWHLLRYGARVFDVYSTNSLIVSLTPDVQKILKFFTFFVYALNNIEGSIGVYETEGMRDDMKYSLALGGMFNKLLKQDEILCAIILRNDIFSNDKSARAHVVELLKNTKFFNNMIQEYGVQNLQHYFINYASKAAQRLFLSFPYREITPQKKDKHEQWFKQELMKRKKDPLISAYQGLLLLGNNALKNNKFSDVEIICKDN